MIEERVMERWQRADVELVAARGEEMAAQAAQLSWIAIAEDEGTHRRLGFGSLFEYVRSRLRLGKKAALERVRMATALRELPKLKAALGAGTLTMCGVRELTRVVVPETEAAWLEETVGQPVHVIEALVSGLEAGDLPGTPPDPEKIVVERRFELKHETVALLKQARQMLQKDAERGFSDDELLAELARRTIADLQAGTKAKPLHRKVLVNLCPECESVHQLGAGEWLRIDPSTLGKLDVSEAIVMPQPHVGADGDDIPAQVRAEVFVRDHGRCVVPGCTATTYLHFHHLIPREQRGPHEAWNISLLCSGHHGDHHAGSLLVRGPCAGNLNFFHRDGTPYGHQPAFDLRRHARIERDPAPRGAA